MKSPIQTNSPTLMKSPIQAKSPNLMKSPIQPKSPIQNQNKHNLRNESRINGTLPLSARTSSRTQLFTIQNQLPHGSYKRSPKPRTQGIIMSQNGSNHARNQDLSTIEEEYNNNPGPFSPPLAHQDYRIRNADKTKSKMVSEGTQYYISDTPLLRKKKVIFRPVDRRNPIAKYLFNHSFIETIYVSNSSYKKRRHIPENIPHDFLARNFYYYSRYPSAVPPMPKTIQEIKTENSEINNHSVVSNVKENLVDETHYTKKERDEIVSTLYDRIIHYLEDKEDKQSEINKTQQFAKLMFNENTRLQKELTKLRSELSAERVLRERAEEELIRYQNLMNSTLLRNN